MSERRSESHYIRDHVLNRLEASGELLPGSSEDIRNRIDTSGRDHLSVAGAVFAFLRDPGNARYIVDPAGFTARTEGAAGTRWAFDLLPFRGSPARDDAFRRLAIKVNGSPDFDSKLEAVATALYERSNRDWHASPPPLPAAEQNARAALKRLEPFIVDRTVDLDDLAERWAKDAAGMGEQRLIRAFAGRLQDLGIAECIPISDVVRVAEHDRREEYRREVDAMRGSVSFAQNSL